MCWFFQGHCFFTFFQVANAAPSITTTTPSASNSLGTLSRDYSYFTCGMFENCGELSPVLDRSCVLFLTSAKRTQFLSVSVPFHFFFFKCNMCPALAGPRGAYSFYACYFLAFLPGECVSSVCTSRLMAPFELLAFTDVAIHRRSSLSPVPSGRVLIFVALAFSMLVLSLSLSPL